MGVVAEDRAQPGTRAEPSTSYPMPHRLLRRHVTHRNRQRLINLERRRQIVA